MTFVKPINLEMILAPRADEASPLGVGAESIEQPEVPTTPLSPLSGPIHGSEGGLLRGRVVAIGATGLVLVEIPSYGSAHPFFATSIIPLTDDDVGQEVIMGLETGDLPRPVILGSVWNTNTKKSKSRGKSKSSSKAIKKLVVEAGHDRIVISSEEEIELRCGEASIVLTREGKVLIRGTYVSSQSSGVNRVRGGSVHLN